MKAKTYTPLLVLLFLVFAMSVSIPVAAQSGSDAISTNKDRLLTIAIQGEVAPAEPSRSYVTTWDGKPKMAIGIGGINYTLTIGDKIFGWANGDRATVGVSTIGTNGARGQGSWLTFSAIGNEARVLSGKARGEKGVVIGKFGSYVLLHFDPEVVDELTIGDTFQVKARGTGLQIEGFDDVILHGIDPDVLEKMEIKVVDGKLEVPVVKEIPAEIMGQGSGGGSLTGNWHIQTCYPPDIEKYGLDDLRYGDLVILEDTQTDFGKGYYRGGATIGVVCAGPSDISGMGIGITPILSTRFGKITSRIDETANIGKYLGLRIKKRAARDNPKAIKTNKAQLIETAVQAVVQPARSGGYSTTFEGKPKVAIGMASINYTVSLGDPAYGWASADHVEPDVTVQGRDRESPSQCAIAILACIGNPAEVISGEAKGAKGYYIGRHAGSDDLCWFPKDVLEKLTLNDKIHVRAKGVGLKIEGFEDVRVNKLSPEVLENMGLTIEGDQLVVPVVMEVPGHIMGSGIGGPFIEYIDYDIQTTDPAIVEEYNLKKIRIGDVIAIRDHYDYYGRGRYEGAVTIGVCIHGWSDYAGHGPGLNPVLAALPGKIKTKIDPHANTAHYLGIK